MLDTKKMSNLSSLYLNGYKLDWIKNENCLNFVSQDIMTYNEFMEKNKDAEDSYRLWLDLKDKEREDLRKYMLKLPKEITLIADEVIRSYHGYKDSGLCHKREYGWRSLDGLYFKKYLMEKYKLDGFQLIVLDATKDLLDILYSEYEIMHIQNKDGNLPYFIYDGSMGDKIIKNLKLLVNNNDMYDMRLNNFSLLVNNYIFYIDIEKLLSEYSNLTASDLKRLLFVSKDDFYNVISLLNSCDSEFKGKILYLIEPLKSESEIFPCMIDDVVSDVKPWKSKTVTILDKNEVIFNKYNYFFRDNLDIFKLIDNFRDNSEMVDFLVTLKKSFIYNIPSLVDTRRTIAKEVPYTDYVKGPNCGDWKMVTGYETVYVEKGELYTGLDMVEKYAKVIKFVMESINNGDSMSVDDLFELDMDVDTYNFLTSAYGMFVMNKKLGKIKSRKYEYVGCKPKL